MSDPFVKRDSRLRYFLIISGIVVVALLAVIIVALVASAFFNNQGAGETLPRDAPLAQVSISNPNEGAQITAGESLFVNAIAIGPDAFLSMELWVNGELAGVQAAPSGGVHPFSTSFLWVPKEPGYHSLIAAVIDFEGQKTISPQVVVVITQEEGGGDIVAPSHDDSVSVFPPPPGGAYTPPSPPGADDSVGPANVSSSSPGDLADDPSGNGSPAAPELVVNAGQCGANLSIHDLSDNEQGFIVYRQTVNSPTWQQIATLSYQSLNDWLTYADDGLAGALTYYVSAVNGNGESASNLALVNVDPANCPGELGKATTITVEVVNLMPELAAEMSYCYKSTDGISWSRWPQSGFLTPGEDNIIKGGPVVQMPSLGFDGQPLTMSLGLFMECWGWQDGILVKLGDFFIEDVEPQVPGNQMVAGKDLSVEVVVDTGNGFDPTDFYPMGGGGYELGVSQVGLKLFSAEIPGVFLWHTTDAEECGNHLPDQDPLTKFVWCDPYLEWGENLQPYLIWFPGPGSGGMFDLRPGCIGGGEVCKSYEELLAEAEQTGGEVGFEVTSVSDVGYLTWPVTKSHVTMFVVPPLACKGEMRFSVSLWYRPGTKDLPSVDTYYGPPSNWIQVPCLPSYVEIGTTKYFQDLDVTFTTLNLTETDDGGNINSLEIFGYFRVIAPAMGYEVPGPFDPSNTITVGTRRYLNLATWDEQGDECPDDTHDWFTSPGSGCPPTVWNGSYNLSLFELCQGESKKYCDTGFLQKNNTQQVFVKDGDALGLEVLIYDWDDASANDLVCQGAIITPSKSLADWANTHNETYTIITGTTDSGQCTVQIEINAVNP
jgi:hypothetical protein